MRKFAIATIAIAAAAFWLLGGAVESHAGEGPWCHTFGGSQGTIENCRLATLDACRFEIQGNGGSCSPNPHWPGYAQAQRRTAQPAGLYPWPWR